MIWKTTLDIYFLELLCVDGLVFVLHKCNVNTFETLDPSDVRHGILREKISSHNNGELSWIFLANALWRDVCWIQFNFLCLNSRNFENGLEGDYNSVREKKVAIAATNLMDGCTIPFIQDVGALWWKILSIILEVRKWKITFDVTTIWRWVLYMLFRLEGSLAKQRKCLKICIFRPKKC